MSQDLISKQDGPALRITINRPDAGNAMSDDMALELTRLLEGAGANTQFVVLKGAGKDFCIGRASMGQAPATRPEALERRDQSEVVYLVHTVGVDRQSGFEQLQPCPEYRQSQSA